LKPDYEKAIPLPYEKRIKPCKKCGEIKSFEEFRKHKKGKDGREGRCKSCAKSSDKIYRDSNSDKVKEACRKWREKNPETVSAYAKENHLKNKDRISEKNKEWRIANKEKVKENWLIYYGINKEERKKKDKMRYAKNPDDVKNRKKKWRLENPARARAIDKRSRIKRYSNPKGKLNNAMSSGMYGSLKKGSKANRHWEDLVSFTVDQLKTHIEKLFKPGMTWGNYGTAWHIDHKIPISVFNFERPEDIDFRLCWSLKNLQPLDAIENMKKHNHIDKPFQPSLAMAVGG
jgi:hypothetical protein